MTDLKCHSDNKISEAFFLLKEIGKIIIELKTWASSYIHIKWFDVITHPCPYFNGDLPSMAAFTNMV